MKPSPQAIVADSGFHLERARIHSLLTQGMKHPLVIVCAGAGYGKTNAVQDFIRKSDAATMWVQLSERDNVGTRFWENVVNAAEQLNMSFSKELAELGFPDTGDRLSRFFASEKKHWGTQKHIIVFDDFHLIENASVLGFMTQLVHNRMPNSTVIIVSRSTPAISIAKMVAQGKVFEVSETELKFTGAEVSQLFRRQNLMLQPEVLRDILNDTDGWAFAVNIIVRAYQKSQRYEGYLKDAVKTNIFLYMEEEIWSGLSENLRLFLTRLSLIDHLSISLIELLAKNQNGGLLLGDLERESAYVRRDTYINAYVIHHLFLDFLRRKQDNLSEAEKRETYEIAADWCSKNGFMIDALSYYEKIGNYSEITETLLRELPLQMPQDVAQLCTGIYDRAPAEMFDSVEYAMAMHVRTALCQGDWMEAYERMVNYEQKCLQLPEDDGFRNRSLGSIYYCWGIMKHLSSTFDHSCDAHIYYVKAGECWSRFPVPYYRNTVNHPNGPWVSVVGDARAGSLQAFNDSLAINVANIAPCHYGGLSGTDDLARGELALYQGDPDAAETLFQRAFIRAREHDLFDNMNKALYYLLRIAIIRGNFAKCEEALTDMDAMLQSGKTYQNCYVVYNNALAWYYFFLRMPESFPDWLKEDCKPYRHAYFIENFENQLKLRYFYLTKSFPRFLAYTHEMRQRESVLYGRVELLAMEACIFMKIKDKQKAIAVLKEAYDEAAPNGIILPFIELGKDMRTLTTSALKEPGCGIPAQWLEDLNRKAASFAKRQAYLVTEYQKANGIENDISLTPRELDILADILQGLSRTQIAANRNLSPNTVKTLVNIIYEKLEAENLVELVRIAIEKKLV